MTQALEPKDRLQQQSSEDQVTKRHLKFLMFLIEAAAKDPVLKETLREKAENFKVLDQ